MSKKLNRILIMFPFFGSLISQSFAQETAVKKKEKKVYCKCAIRGLPRGKFVSVKYEVRPFSSITTTDKTANYLPIPSGTTIKNNSRIEVKIKVPIINKPYLSIVAGLRYNKEQFKFKSTNTENPFYTSLEDRNLKTVGLNLTVIKPTQGNKFWMLRLSGNLNGDYGNPNISRTDFLKFSVSPALAWRKSDDLIYAVGLSYSYAFGRPLIFPTFAVNYNFNDQWSIESILPAFIKFRYGFNENFYWYNSVELDGAAYRLSNTEASLAQYKELHLYRSEIKYTTSLEKQIVGWLWAGLEIGGIHNLSFNLTNSTSGRKDVIFKNRLSEGFLCNFNLYLVPPRRLYRRLTENL